MILPRSLARRYTWWLAGSFAVLALVLLAMFSALLAWPMARRAADDLAGLMVLSAQTWAELPPATREDFELELRQRHGLSLRPRTASPAPDEWHPPMIELLEAALNRRLATKTHLHREQVDGSVWYWIDLPVGTQGLSVGLPRDRYDSRPLSLLAAGLLASLGIAWLAARWLASRMAEPVQRLERAMAEVGQGERAAQVAEDGPAELASLSRHFNQMTRRVDELISARTTLLAGISHDLRTPLARMRLAVEMLRDRHDPAMLDQLDAEIDRTNRLIGEVLGLARGLAREPAQPSEIRAFLENLALQWGHETTPVRVASPTLHARIPRMALSRALGNLLQNSLRYAPGQPVELVAQAQAGALRLAVLDRGPGIPAAQVQRMLQPFQRGEPSRSTSTGGSGLGLAIVRELARAHGWTLDLGDRPGGGLQAWLTLPDALAS